MTPLELSERELIKKAAELIANSKKIEDITEKDLLEIEQNPIFEDLQVEFKYQYDKDSDELRKDVV